MYEYPKLDQAHERINAIVDYAHLQQEVGAPGVAEVLERVDRCLADALAALQSLAPDPQLAAREPDDYAAILALRPEGPRRLWKALSPAYASRLSGAFHARAAGCTLGAIVENWSVAAMREFAAQTGDAFPPTQYWKEAATPWQVRYEKSACRDYTRTHMDGLPVDDDMTYTALGLLIAEQCGLDFTTADVGRIWLKYLPVACTAEAAALDNLRRGVPAGEAALSNNPYVQWIGADIRSDPFAYMAPGWPERAARMAYQDAYLSHRRNGIYGEMFFAAAQSAAFAVNDALEALRIGLTEIPADCLLAHDLRWALEVAPNLRDYRDGREAVDQRFGAMHPVHTNNNACLTVFGLALGKGDVTETLSQTVAMGLDNDCTAATAGSIAGAIAGIEGVDARWTVPFHNRMLTYMREDAGSFAIDELLARFHRQAELAFAE